MGAHLLVLLLIMNFPTTPQASGKGERTSNAEARALGYLIREVPAWSARNHCYSCHNNGDAVRALYTARRLNYSIPAAAIEDTTRWLVTPGQWDHNKGKAGFSDKGLARIQFAAALVDAVDAGLIKDRQTLVRAAELVAELQRKDGSWQIDGDSSIGSPTTYGACLATHQARRTLQKADAQRYRQAIARADRWLRTITVKNVLGAGAVLLALRGATDAEALRQQRQCLAIIRKGQAEEGGWGPYVAAPPEPFDTAIVMLALAGCLKEPDAQPMLGRGRAFLISIQRPDGSWPETTRPPGSESYAQRLSTSGWATLALLLSRDKERR